MNSSRRVILATGFEPFAGHVVNPSAEVAKALDGRVVGSAVVRSAVLPVHHAEGVPAYVSNTAGTYLCNLTMYGTLDWLAARNHPARAGFVHLPLSPPMVAASGLDQPSMDVGLMVRGVEIALGVVARTTFPGKEVRP